MTTVTFRDSSDAKSKEVTYVYDVFDRRIAKDVDDDGDSTIDRGEVYMYDSAGKRDPATGVLLDDVVLVYDRSDSLVERLFHGPRIDQPLASEDGAGDLLWLLADNQGTIKDVAEYDAGSDTTTVVNHLTHGGFGQVTSQSNSAYEPRHTYTAREWDADSELFYYRARWYDPLTGRFISEDPLSFAAGDSNISRNVANAPTNLSDPSGLQQGAVGPFTTGPPRRRTPSWSLTDEYYYQLFIRLNARRTDFPELYDLMGFGTLGRALIRNKPNGVIAVRDATMTARVKASYNYDLIRFSLKTKAVADIELATLLHGAVHATDSAKGWYLDNQQQEGLAYAVQYNLSLYDDLATIRHTVDQGHSFYAMREQLNNLLTRHVAGDYTSISGIHVIYNVGSTVTAQRDLMYDDISDAKTKLGVGLPLIGTGDVYNMFPELMDVK